MKMITNCTFIWILLLLCGWGVGVQAQETPKSNSIAEVELKKFAEELERTINEANSSFLVKSFDVDTILQRSTTGFGVKSKIINAYHSGARKAFSAGGLPKQITDQIAEGGSYKLLRLHVKNNRNRALFRFMLADGSVNYHDFILIEKEKDVIKIDDLYIFLSGETISQSLRRGFRGVAANANKDLLDKLLGSESEYMKNIPKILSVTRNLKSGKFSEALKIYKALPESVRKDKNLLLIALTAAQNVNDKEYSYIIAEFKKFHPTDVCVDFVSIDAHIIKKEFKQAHECIKRVNVSLGGDHYLKVLDANVYFIEENYVEARRLAELAIKNEPGLDNAYWSLLDTVLAQKDYKRTVEIMDILIDDFFYEFNDLTKEDTFAGFVKSKEYTEWKTKRAEQKPKE